MTTMFTSFMSDNSASLYLPDVTTHIDKRAFALSGFQWSGVAERAELRLLCQWRVRHALLPSDVTKALLLHEGLPIDILRQNPRHESLPGLYVLQREIWQRLMALARGDSLPGLGLPSQDSDRYREDMTRIVDQWFKGCLPALHNALRGRFIDVTTITEALPEVLFEVENAAEQNWFQSLYAMGEILHRQANTLGEQADIWLLDALARALLVALGELQAMDTLDEAHAKQALGRVRLWWRLLKGFVYDSIALESSVLVSLASEPEILDRVSTALLSGVTVVNRYRDAETQPVWHAPSDDIVKNFITRDLVSLLREAVHSAASQQ